MSVRHFLNLVDAGPVALKAMLADAHARGQAAATGPRAAPMRMRRWRACAGDDLREELHPHPRVFRYGDAPVGGSAIVMDAGGMQLGRGESIADTARVLSRMVDAIMIRTNDHAKIENWPPMPACR
jgi:ornithine carbamoyltransferase